MSIADKLQTIAENEQKVHKAGKLSLLKDSKYMNANVSGSALFINDVSPIEPNIGVKVASKNLCDENVRYKKSNTIIRYYDDNGFLLRKGVTYRLSVSNATEIISSTETTKPSYTIYITRHSDNTDLQMVSSSSSTGIRECVYTPTEDVLCTFQIYSTVIENGVYLVQNSKLQIEIGETTTEYTPYVEDISAVKVGVCGKNLININEVKKLENWINNTVGSVRWAAYKLNLQPEQQYTLYMEFDKTSYTRVIFTKKDEELIVDGHQNFSNVDYFISGAASGQTSFIAESQYDYYISQNNEHIMLSSLLKAQLELGSTATEYEPYKEPIIHIPNADGIVEGVTNTYPNMTLLTDTDGAIIYCNYYKDIDKVVSNLTTAVALSGGE